MDYQKWLKLKKNVLSQSELVSETNETDDAGITEECVTVSGKNGQTKFVFRMREVIDEHPDGFVTDTASDYVFNAPAMGNWLRVFRKNDTTWEEISIKDLLQ